MGGKNAIIVDDDADLDEAITQVLYSALGFQGQKCSACSRVIVLDAIYETLVRRLTLAAQSIKIGPEGNVLVRRDDIPERGAYVPLIIVEGIRPEHRIAQEEIFGPVLAVVRARDFDQAPDIAFRRALP